MTRGRSLILGTLSLALALARGPRRLTRALRYTPDPLVDLYARPRRPLVLGHRGASASAPENTLPAFAAAIAEGADGVELDAQLSADGVPVVIHDFTLQKTTSGHGLVVTRSLDQLKRLDAGSWFEDGRFAGTTIPTLAEVLDLARGKIVVNVELKVAGRDTRGLERRVADLVIRLGMQRQVIISSFNPTALWRLRRYAPTLPVGLLYAANQPWYLRHRLLAPLLRPDAVHPQHSLATPAHVAAAHARGLRVNVWTVDDPSEARRLASLGVDAIITNRPGEMVRLVNGLALARALARRA